MKFWLVFILALQYAMWSQAGEAPLLAQDPVIEQRLLLISEELRCLVCQNESLAGSRADLAVDLRREIRTLIMEGKSNQDIMDFMVSRYGDFVRYRPPFNPVTWLLWLGPLLLLVAAIIILFRMVRSSQLEAPAKPLDEEQQKKVQSLLRDPELPL